MEGAPDLEKAGEEVDRVGERLAERRQVQEVFEVGREAAVEGEGGAPPLLGEDRRQKRVLAAAVEEVEDEVAIDREVDGRSGRRARGGEPRAEGLRQRLGAGRDRRDVGVVPLRIDPGMPDGVEGDEIVSQGLPLAGQPLGGERVAVGETLDRQGDLPLPVGEERLLAFVGHRDLPPYIRRTGTIQQMSAMGSPASRSLSVPFR